MKTVFYISILFGPLLCNVVCENGGKVNNLIDKITNKYETDKLNFIRKEDLEKEIENGSNLNEEFDKVESLLENDENIEKHENKITDDEESDYDIFSGANDTRKSTDNENFDDNQLKRSNKPKFRRFSRLNEVKKIFPLRESKFKQKLSNVFREVDSGELLSEERLSEEVSDEDISNDEEVSEEEDWFSSVNIVNNPEMTRIKSTYKKTVNRYICKTDHAKDSVIVYGARSWSFERQDVNLTLSYPMGQTRTEDKTYIVTGFHVILITDGEDSKGYILGGGVLRRSISLSFISPAISYLLYEFQVYGTPVYSASDTDNLNNMVYMCS